jgi:hypothetical protein
VSDEPSSSSGSRPSLVVARKKTVRHRARAEFSFALVGLGVIVLLTVYKDGADDELVAPDVTYNGAAVGRDGLCQFSMQLRTAFP